ncbi:MAG: molybdenum ABC transporter ATP-binding protein [Deltaproteobacteria bacterium]|nr:molybdenum ABC transporter ATP-binding protein [Deltaproteobacteria bacterium]
MLTPYKFVKWDVPPLETLIGDYISSLFEKRHNLNQSEKDVVFRELQNNSYSRRGIPRGGWMFPFMDVLKRFLVKLKHCGWQEVYAPNKTSIRAYYRSGVLEVIEHRR